MPRAEQLKAYTTFVRGLITEASELTFPENASFDEDNMVLERTGKRRRRRGVDFETGFSLSTQTFTDASLLTSAITTKTWNSVAGTGSRNFLVVQIGTTLYFHTLGSSILSANQKSFTVNLATYAVAGATNQGADKVQMTSGRGKLYVVGRQMDPIYVTYDATGDSISVTKLTLKIRDFEGVDDGLDPEEEPATLSTEHSYNLKNQGWNSPGNGEADPVTTYHTSQSVYPPNSKQWWVGKNSSEVFDATLLTKFSQGSMLAPRGHFILDVFNKDRDTASGLTGITTETESYRPEAIAFYSGRVWYAGIESTKINGSVFYSQVVETDVNAERCYQDADPTSEDVSDPVDTDGGVVEIPGIGSIKVLFEYEDKLLVMADNGVWAIQGSEGGGFKATDFAVVKVGSVGIIGADTVVDVDGTPLWWSATGIYTVGSDNVTGRLKPQSLTATTIQTFYSDIGAENKEDAIGIYDSANRRVRWFYGEYTNGDLKTYTKVLNFDVDLGAFYPWTVYSLASASPHIASAYTTPVLSTVSGDQEVVDSSFNDIIDSSGNRVVAVGTERVSFDTFTGLLCIAPQGSGNNKYTFGQFQNTSYKDWESQDDTGIDAPAYLDTGYELMGDISRFKQAGYLLCHFNKTSNSGCFVKAKWDWHDDPDLGKHSTKFQAYREKSVGQGPVVVSRSKIRGKGRTLQLRYESESGKDLDLLGWAIKFSGNTGL